MIGEGSKYIPIEITKRKIFDQDPTKLEAHLGTEYIDVSQPSNDMIEDRIDNYLLSIELSKKSEYFRCSQYEI